MKRINTSRSSGTFQGPAGSGTGHFQDVDSSGGTQYDATWSEAMQNMAVECIEGLGGSLDGTDAGQLWALLRGPLLIHGTWTDKIRVGDPLDTGTFSTTIDTEGGDLRPLYGYIETDKAYLSQGVWIGTQTSSVQCIDADLDCDFRNVNLSSGGVQGIALVASTGRVATNGDVYAVGGVSAGCIDLLGVNPKAGLNPSGYCYGTNGFSQLFSATTTITSNLGGSVTVPNGQGGAKIIVDLASGLTPGASMDIEVNSDLLGASVPMFVTVARAAAADPVPGVDLFGLGTTRTIRLTNTSGTTTLTDCVLWVEIRRNGAS